MEIRTSQRGNATIIELTGRLDILQAREFESHFEGFLKTAPATLALDMTGLHYIDSSGIAALTKARRVVTEYGGAVILFGMSPSVVNVLKFGAIDDFFRILTLEEFNRNFPV